MKTILQYFASVRGDKWPNKTRYQPIKTLNMRVVVFFVTLRKQLAESANKSYHVYKVIFVLHIYNKSLGIN